MLQMMTDLEDEEGWAMEDEVEDVDSDVSLDISNFSVLALYYFSIHVYSLTSMIS